MLLFQNTNQIYLIICLLKFGLYFETKAFHSYSLFILPLMTISVRYVTEIVINGRITVTEVGKQTKS